MKTGTALLAALLTLAAMPALAQGSGPVDVSGTIDRLEGTTLFVRDDRGTVERFVLAPDVRLTRATPATLADIRPDDFVASAAMRGMDGKLHSTELRIFSEALRGLGEGQRPMNDARGQTMTNATVTGTAILDGSNDLKVKFAGGESELVVDPAVPVSRIDVAKPDDLKTGEKVRVMGVHTAEGALANRIALQ